MLKANRIGGYKSEGAFSEKFSAGFHGPILALIWLNVY